MFGQLRIGERFRYYRGMYVKTAKNEAVYLPLVRNSPLGGITKIFRSSAKIHTATR